MVENNSQEQQNKINMKTFKISLRNCNKSELLPINQKSFYGKAVIYHLANGTRVLKSYSTIIAMIDKKGNIRRFWGGWSATTGKHIKAFCGLNKKGFTDLPLADFVFTL